MPQTCLLYTSKVAKERKRSAELDVLIKKLYETYAMGKLEEKRFALLCAEYEKEQAELEQLLASEQAQLDQFHEDTDRASHFLACLLYTSSGQPVRNGKPPRSGAATLKRWNG